VCNASDYAVEVILGQRTGKKLHVICYVTHTLIDNQLNYTVIGKEFWVAIFGFEKFRSHLIKSHVIVYTNNSALLV